MVQKAAAKRGRPPKFDREAVISIVNDMAAQTAPEAAAHYRQRIESGLRLALERASDTQATERASLLTASILGVNLVSKMTADPDEIGRHIDAMISTAEGWQATA